MSKTDDSIEDARRGIGKDKRDLLGIARRMSLRVTSGAFWQAVGVLLLDNTTRETVPAENFSGIGFYARPAPNANAEGIMINTGGAENPVLIATRDEDTRKKIAKIDQDETAAFNTKAILHINKLGKILAYAAGHVADAVGLAKASELNNLRAFVMQQFSGPGHTHAIPGPAATTSTVPVVAPVAAPAVDYAGTTVLKGQ